MNTKKMMDKHYLIYMRDNAYEEGFTKPNTTEERVSIF